MPKHRADKYQGRPCHAPTHTPKRWTRCTGLHTIPDRPRRDDQGDSGTLDRLQCVRQSVQFRTLNFIHIYMDMFYQKH